MQSVYLIFLFESQGLILIHNWNGMDSIITVHASLPEELKEAYRNLGNKAQWGHPHYYAVAKLHLFAFYLSESLLLSILFFYTILLFLLPPPPAPPSTLSVSMQGGGKLYADAQVEKGGKSIVRLFEVFWKTSQGRRSCQGDR